MNITKSIIARIEDRFAETKNPCKSYATEEAAEKVGMKYAALAGEWYCSLERPARYVVVYVPKMGRYTVAFDMSEMMQRTTFLGGYVGMLSNKNFFSY